MFYHPLLVMAMFTLFLVAIPIPSYAEEHAQDHHEHHGHGNEDLEAHVHGIAELFVILEAKTLNIELHSPAMNIVGFEHPPRTKEQISRISQAKALLSNGEKLFQFQAGQCNIIKTHIDFGKLHIEKKHHHDHHEEDQHSNIEASYQYQCEQPKELRGLSTNMLNQFPGVESLHVQWIIEGHQGADTLTHGKPKITF